jgi:dTDP-4-dehydrorhamnose reductase
LRVLITGANGMLGKDLCATVPHGTQVLATDIVGASIKLDITDAAQVRGVFKRERPEVVIHCAAYTQVDRAETNQTEAYRLNALGAEIVAQAAASVSAAMCYLSTDFVFDGSKGAPYHEYDSPNPLNVYAASKLAGEQAVIRFCPNHWVVRTAWLFGANGACFPAAILRAAREGRPLRVVADQVGCPTHTLDLARALWLIVSATEFGTHHVVNTGRASWYELAREVLDQFGLASVEVTPIPSSEWPSPARRPHYSVLTSVRPSANRPELRHWKAAVADYVSIVRGSATAS